MTCPSTASLPGPVKPGEFDTQLDHLILLAALPGWKAYAWHRAKELDADTSGLYSGMAEALRRAMTSASADQASS